MKLYDSDKQYHAIFVLVLPSVLLTNFYLMFLLRRLDDFKEFADVIEAVKDKGVAVAVASPDDVETANKEHPSFFEVKKVL